MTKIKSYTDLEQSKKLVEILPLESADMKWYFWKSEIDAPKLPTFGYSKDAAENYKSTEAVYLPCWSLAALMEVMPESIADDKNELIAYMSIYKYDSLWVCAYDYENQEDGNYISFSKESFVDACYEMILKLHELKML